MSDYVSNVNNELVEIVISIPWYDDDNAATTAYSTQPKNNYQQIMVEFVRDTCKKMVTTSSALVVGKKQKPHKM